VVEATIPRDRTIAIVEFINLAIAGLGSVRDRILIGVDADGHEPLPGHPRADTVADTAQLALDDLIQLRRVVATAIHAVAATISGGVERETVMKWAYYDSDDRRPLIEDRFLNQDNGE
jgi:hypothetical protein